MNTLNLLVRSNKLEHLFSRYCLGLIEQDLLIEVIKKDEVNKAEMFTVMAPNESELERAARILLLSKKYRADKAELAALQKEMSAISENIINYLSLLPDHKANYILKRNDNKKCKYLFQLVNDKLYTAMIA